MSITEQFDETTMQTVDEDDDAYPDNLIWAGQSVKLAEYHERGTDTKFWSYGPLKFGISVKYMGEGSDGKDLYRMKVFQNEEAYQNYCASSFDLKINRLHLGGCFIDATDHGCGHPFKLQGLTALEVRYTPKYGYTAWLGTLSFNRAGEPNAKF